MTLRMNHINSNPCNEQIHLFSTHHVFVVLPKPITSACHLNRTPAVAPACTAARRHPWCDAKARTASEWLKPISSKGAQKSPRNREVSPLKFQGGLKQRKWLVDFFCFKSRWLKYWKRLKFYGFFVFFLAHDDRSSFFCMCKVSVALFWRKILVGSGSYFTRHDVVTEIR